MDFGGGSVGNKKSGLSDATFKSVQQVAKEGSQVALECNHGLMVEAMKQFMFKK